MPRKQADNHAECNRDCNNAPANSQALLKLIHSLDERGLSDQCMPVEMEEIVQLKLKFLWTQTDNCNYLKSWERKFTDHRYLFYNIAYKLHYYGNQYKIKHSRQQIPAHIYTYI